MFELAQVPVQVLVSLGLFFSLYLLVCRILPLGLLCDRLLCLWAVALAVLLASPVTLVRVNTSPVMLPVHILIPVLSRSVTTT